jgi:hypothetical protein
LVSGSLVQLVEVSGRNHSVGTRHGGKKQLGQLPRILFGGILLGVELSQGFAYHLAGIRIPAASNLALNELLQRFGKRDFHDEKSQGRPLIVQSRLSAKNPIREETLFAAALERPQRFSMANAEVMQRGAPASMPCCAHRTHK